jgi:hypothetical protein
MPLNNFAYFIKGNPNINTNAGSIQLTPTSPGPVVIASLSIDTVGSSVVKLDSTFGFHTGGAGGTGVIVRLRRNGQLVTRGREKSTFSGDDEFTLTSLTTVDDAPTGGIVTYELSVQLDPATVAAGNRVKIIGPITLTAEAIS